MASLDTDAAANGANAHTGAALNPRSYSRFRLRSPSRKEFARFTCNLCRGGFLALQFVSRRGGFFLPCSSCKGGAEFQPCSSCRVISNTGRDQPARSSRSPPCPFAPHACTYISLTPALCKVSQSRWVEVDAAAAKH